MHFERALAVQLAEPVLERRVQVRLADQAHLVDQVQADDLS